MPNDAQVAILFAVCLQQTIDPNFKGDFRLPRTALLSRASVRFSFAGDSLALLRALGH